MTSPKPIIILVEDDPLILLHARLALEDAGYAVLAVTTAEEALDCIAYHACVVALFTDIELAGLLGGIALARMVHEQRPDIGIVVTSGKQVPGDAALPARAHFLAKPYTRSQMRRALDACRLAEPA